MRVSKFGTSALFLIVLSLPAPASPEASHFLWSFSGPAGSGYLMGSIHLLKEEYYPLAESILAAFRECRILAVEADISPDKMAETAVRQLQRGMYPEGESLRDHISAETWNLAARKLKELGMDIAGFSRFKPWMLALTIVSMEMMRMGYDPRWGVDRYFLDMAPKDMEIRELEGLDAQMKLFDSFSDRLNDRFLFFNILESDRSRSRVDEMVTAWLQGDVKAMEALVTASIHEHPELAELYRVVVTDRNRSMTEAIEALLSPERKVFVVVGAAHLVGDKGIVARLRRRGFRLQQL